jgi:hypothetical protein
MRFDHYINESDITYEQYIQGVSYHFGLDEGIVDLKDKAVGFIARKFKEASAAIDQMIFDFGLSATEIYHALTERNMFKLLKSFGFSLKTVMSSLNNLTTFIRQGLFEVFSELYKTKAYQKIRQGTIKFDELAEQYPILKKITGPAVAGLLFFMWTQMTFIGNLDYDFDFTNIGLALKGAYSLEEIFGSPEGLMLIGLFATGSIISAPWLGKTIYNLMLALFYTGVKRSAHSESPIVKKIRAKLVTQ